MTLPSPDAGPPSFDLGTWLADLPDLPAIVQAGAPVLRGRARDVPLDVLGTPEFKELVAILVEVMRRAPGVGLAAPQVGVPWRVFVAEDLEERIAQLPEDMRETRGRVALPLTCLINPTIEPAGTNEAVFFEGCLSVRGYAALVPRWSAITVRALDVDGTAVERRFEGWPARIMQHETDHLAGTLYVDRMLSRSLAGEAELPRLSGLSLGEVLAELDVLRR
jgi:peptide deformylase